MKKIGIKGKNVKIGDVAGRDIVNVYPAVVQTQFIHGSVQEEKPDLSQYLRVLVVISAPVADRYGEEPTLPHLDSRNEWQKLSEAIQRSHAPIALYRFMPPTLDALRLALGPQAKELGFLPHVVHFIGHGEKDGLYFEDELCREDFKKINDILHAFQESKIKLVFFNSCHSATDFPNSLCETLIKRGVVESAIGHRKEMPDDDAVKFASGLYRELSAGFRLKDAYENALNKVSTESKDIPKFYGNENLTLKTTGRGEPKVIYQSEFHVPVEMSPFFFGRGKELISLMEILQDANLRGVSITGIGGIGKSSLMIESAQRSAWRFSGGITFGRGTEGWTLTTVLSSIVDQLNLPLIQGHDPESVVYAHIARKPTLLLFDNMEKVRPQELKSLEEFLSLMSLDSNSKAIVTLRPPALQIRDSKHIPLNQGLSTQAGANFLMHLVERDESAIELKEESEALYISQKLHGHPEMLILFANLIKNKPYASVKSQLETLTGELIEKRDELIEWSVQLLKNDGKRLLRYLPIFPECRFNQGAIASAVGVKEDDPVIENGLDELRKSGLVPFDANFQRWNFHPTVREYAEEHDSLNENEHKTSHKRVAEYYLKQADNKIGTHPMKLKDVSELIEANYHFSEAEEWERIYDDVLFKNRFGKNQAEDLDKVLYRLGHYRLLIKLLTPLLSERTGLKKQERSVIINNLGLTYCSLGDYKDAIEYHEKDLAISIEIGDRAGEGMAYGNLGNAYDGLGDYKEAIEYHEKNLAIAKETGDRAGERRAYGNLGIAYKSLGNYKKAIEYLEKCLAISIETENRAGEGKAYSGLGIVYDSLGNYKKAIEYLEKHLAIAIDIEIGDRAGEGSAYCNLGIAYGSLGNYKKAIEYHEKALAISIETENRAGEGRAYGNLGSAYKSLGNYKKAIEYHEKHILISIETGDRAGEGRAYCNLGSAYGSLGNYNKAIECHKQSLRIMIQLGTIYEIAVLLSNLGNSLTRLKDKESLSLSYASYLLSSRLAKKMEIPQSAEYENTTAELKKKLRDKAKEVESNLAFYLSQATDLPENVFHHYLVGA